MDEATRTQARQQPDVWSLLTWVASAVLLYLLASGVAVWVMDFSVYSQYSVIVHTLVGTVSLLPVSWLVWKHWLRREGTASGLPAMIARLSLPVSILCLGSGLLIALEAALAHSVHDVAWTIHKYSAVLFGLLLAAHLAPVLLRFRRPNPTPRRSARPRFLVVTAVLVALPFGITQWLSGSVEQVEPYRSFPDDYAWPHGGDNPFGPSRAQLAGAPWEAPLRAELLGTLGEERAPPVLEVMSAASRDGADGPLERIAAALASAGLDEHEVGTLNDALSRARASLREFGALDPAAMPTSESCGSAGCHAAVYGEWTPSAHGYAAVDTLFRNAQELLAEQQGAAETRLCAGCHDPVALLAGTRDGGSIAGDDLVTHEGVSCVGCHAISATDTIGNGGFTFDVPDGYLFDGSESALASFVNRFLIRSYPWSHRETWGRDLLETSEFCAACHKQTTDAADDTAIGIAQEQNEYDSWRSGHWYREGKPEETLHCRDCHMPLVDSDDPAGDGMHRSHRYLGSNTYMPLAVGVPGGAEHAALTASWLRGELEIPEIADRWADGPVVTIDIVAPEEVSAGELVNLTLVLHNNKTGHDFPAGPLDILASWVEIEVVDNLGRTLLHLGSPEGDAPTTDAPVVYKADWYDKRGLPVERHEIWEAVGSSFKHAIATGDAEIVDVPFRCPAVARPRISDSFSEQGPGERKSDVVMSIDNDAVTTLTVNARLIYRKVTPEFLRRTLAVEAEFEVPTLVLSEATQTIRVVSD